jgi:hypothetical protein
MNLPFPTVRPIVTFAAFALVASAGCARAGVDVKELPDRVRIEIGGRLFTEYRFTGAPHVYYWPMIGPGGVKMTRAYPMEDLPNEAHDHPHHRSLWFSHGEVNGVDFWAEDLSFGKKPPKQPIGKIVHDKILEAKSGDDQGVVKASQKWVAPDGTVVVCSTQTLRVYNRPESERLFDFEITLTAGDKEVVFGDTKEGTCGIRIAESMRLMQPKGQPPGKGHILNSEGLTDDKAWGERAKWVDMYGPIGDKTCGIAFMDHPTNPRHPTRWHARNYGLFAANPFFAGTDKTLAKGACEMKLPAGQSVTFKYRLIFHEGDPAAARIADRYKAYVDGGL